MFYDLSKALSYNALWNFLDSNRRLGKTFSTLKFVCNAYKKRNEEFIYVRRTKAEIGRIADGLFSSLKNEGILRPFEFRCKGDCIIYNPETHLNNLERVKWSKSYKKTPVTKPKHDKICGYLIPLSLVHQYKQNAFPNVKTIIFEEYICENNRYLRDEPQKLVSLCETVFKNRNDGRVICLGSSNSRSNPYFDFFELYDHENNEFTHYSSRSILVGHTVGKEFLEKKLNTRFARSIRNINYSAPVLANTLLKDDFTFVDKMKSVHKKPFINLIIDGRELAVFFANEKLFIKKGRIDGYITYSIDNDVLYENAIKGKISKDFHLKQLAKFIREGDVYFNTPDVKRAMEPFIKKV
ncbi:phage DNA encapsidation protein [Bartonella harrusi]|uniref:Phage DNA encapsidation protein n=1 Tax=Bartonella harrusi TaxID=2961895 RepID=A0ABY5ES73_9HYPH|nr:phage DNA encapsidation protein [Bartonella harrusi]UTO27930.1 phage DNA encapsidation protein [Bartonella harrusi]